MNKRIRKKQQKQREQLKQLEMNFLNTLPLPSFLQAIILSFPEKRACSTD